MHDVYIGSGKLDDKGVYADRKFNKGEVVIKYNLKPLSEDEYKQLPDQEIKFVHSHHGKLFLYSEPERYVNHSDTPNTYQDLENHCDIALRDIEKGEEITTDSNKDDIT
jgi:SET domain-containing protein